MLQPQRDHDGRAAGDHDDEEKIATLQLVFGAAAAGVATKIIDPQALILYGIKAENGKSQILEVARGQLPPSAVSNVPPGEFGDERARIKLAGKLLNASDELSTARAIAGDKFKASITGNVIDGRDLYESRVDFHPTAQHIYAANILPPFTGGMDPGTQRRLFVMPFLRTIPPEERKWGNNLGQRIAVEEADMVLAWTVEGARRLIRENRLARPEWAQRALREWATTADPVIAWCEGRIRHAKDRDKRVWGTVAYASFRAFAKMQGYSMSSLPARSAFTQRAQGELSRKKITYGSSGNFRGFFFAELVPVDNEERAELMKILVEMDNESAGEERRRHTAEQSTEAA